MNPTTHIHDLYSTVVNDLEILAKTKASEKKRTWFKQQHKGSIKYYGIKTPDIRRLIKKYTHEFNQLSLKEKFGLAKMFYTSNWFEQATIGDALVEYAVKTMTQAHFDLLDEIVDYFNNWASVDWLCLHGLQSLLLHYPEEIIPLLRKWNCSESRWKKRASVVAFVWKIGVVESSQTLYSTCVTISSGIKKTS